MKVKVVIPALDEERSIGLVLGALPRDRIAEVIVVDNGSRDRTAEVAIAAGARVVAEPRRGYGRACLAGIAAAGECDAIAFLDADFSDRPEELPLLLAPIERGAADLVVGSRMIGRASRAALLPQARFGNRLAAFLLRRWFGLAATDLGPFRVVTTAALARLAMDDADFGWTVQMQARAGARKLRVAEVEVSYRPRIGRSKISGTIAGSFRAGTKILLTLWRERTSSSSCGSTSVPTSPPAARRP